MDNKNNVKQNPDATIAMSEHTDCPYCKALKVIEPEEELKECPYCVRNESEESSLDSCKYCMDTEDKKTECKYCNREQNQPIQEIPLKQELTTQTSEEFASQDLNDPAIPKPQIGDNGPIEANVIEDAPSVSNTKLDENTTAIQNPEMIKESVMLDNSKEAMQNIVNEIEGSGSPKESAQNIDSAEMAVGTEMEGNVSRQSGFDQQAPGDMGMPGGNITEEPESDVLTEGLNYYENDIQRERVIGMVSQALQGFKQCKSILDKAQIQAPQLYNSSLMMLKAMIEMAKMLGLNQETSTEPIIQEDTQQNPWHDPFPIHPDNQGSDAQKSIGQGVGKLPTSKTTQHVSHPVQTEGSVNEFGQMKITNPNTGKASFINMLEPRVLNEKGVPVKGK